jgi:hypothetical protein
MNHTCLLFYYFWGNILKILFEYSWKKFEKIFLNHDNFSNNTLISIALNFCQNLSFKKNKFIKHVLLLLKNIGYKILLLFFHIFCSFDWFQIYSQVPMIYYECYHISKSYNFNTKLNYIFNNMEHQALVRLVKVHVTMTTPIWKCWDSLPCILPHLWMHTWILVHSFNFLPLSFLSSSCELKVRVTTIKFYMFILRGITWFDLVVATAYYINFWFP